MAPMKAETGIVKIHAQIIFRAIYHLTAVVRFVRPTPTIDPAMTCVVETGMPNNEQSNMVIVPDDSAQNPWIGLSLVIFTHIVLITRLPPQKVPNPMVV